MPTSADGNNDLLTVHEAAELLGVSVATIHRRIDTDELPTFQKLPGLRGAYLLRRSDVEALLFRGGDAA